MEDIDISGWILEFLLLQNSVDNQTLNNLIRVLPIPDNNPNLKKRIYLRKIESDIENGTISESTIELLEHIEEMDFSHHQGKISEAMKAAYRTLAMYLTAKSIEDGAGDMEEKLADAVGTIRSGQFRHLKMSDVAEMVGLSEDDLYQWMNEIEAGVFSINVCQKVLSKMKELDVSEVLRRYINEEKEKIGPSFLELAAETILNSATLSKIMGLIDNPNLNNQTEDNAQTVSPSVNKAPKTRVRPRHKPVRRSSHGSHRGAKIVDPMETHPYDTISTPEVTKLKEDLRTSSFELHKVVKDPLPEALFLAESLKANTSKEHIETVDLEASSPSRIDKGKSVETNQKKRSLPSIMERNSTAHTVEWNDSIDTEGSPKRPHLSSPRERPPVSPLNVYQMAKLGKRRKKKKWTVLEEDTLRTGVQKYGKGNWKLILGIYRDIFEDRTEVDLKDKWRNMTRYQ